MVEFADKGHECCPKAQQLHREKLQKPTRKRRRTLVNDGVDTERPVMLSGETVEIQNWRLQAEAAASEILARVDAEGGRITDGDVVHVFSLWSFKKNGVRLNVIPEGQQWVFREWIVR